MAQQQRIMTESARAQLWPRLSLGYDRSYDRDFVPTKFEIAVENVGTGPAIVEEVRMTLNGAPVGTYRDLWRVSGYPDTAYSARSNSQFSNTVVQAGESRTVFGLTVNPELMRHFVGWLRESRAPWTVEVCYRSVTNEPNGDWTAVAEPTATGPPDRRHRRAAGLLPRRGYPAVAVGGARAGCAGGGVSLTLRTARRPPRGNPPAHTPPPLLPRASAPRPA